MPPMETDQKVLENKLRRIAARRGFLLEKSRRKDPQAIDYGGYMLIDKFAGNAAVLGSSPYAYSATLHDVAAYFSDAGEEIKTTKSRPKPKLSTLKPLLKPLPSRLSTPGRLKKGKR